MALEKKKGIKVMHAIPNVGTRNSTLPSGGGGVNQGKIKRKCDLYTRFEGNGPEPVSGWCKAVVQRKTQVISSLHIHSRPKYSIVSIHDTNFSERKIDRWMNREWSKEEDSRNEDGRKRGIKGRFFERVRSSELMVSVGGGRGYFGSIF